MKSNTSAGSARKALLSSCRNLLGEVDVFWSFIDFDGKTCLANKMHTGQRQ